MVRAINHDRYARDCYKKKKITVKGREVPVLRMLSKLPLMDAYVAESPLEAETLFYALRDNPLFVEQAKGLGMFFIMKYQNDSKRNQSARHIRMDVNRLEKELD